MSLVAEEESKALMRSTEYDACAGLSGQPDFSALRELEAIAAAYDPNSPKFRFNYLFLNVVDNPAARLKPVDVDEIQWRGAIHKAGGLDNPDRLWPVQAKGFKDLLARKEAQVALRLLPPLGNPFTDPDCCWMCV